MKELYKALAAFQDEVPTIKKNATGYGYKFADLEEINKVIKPLLKKHGLGYTQPLDNWCLRTVLFHIESGETIESTVSIPSDVELKGQNTFQVMGSAITYLRRYSLSSILGLVTDEDADASGEQVKPIQKTYVPSKTAKASLKQKEFIANLLRQHGVDKDAMKDYLATNYGINGDFSQADAQMIIDDLNSKES